MAHVRRPVPHAVLDLPFFFDDVGREVMQALAPALARTGREGCNDNQHSDLIATMPASYH